MSTLTSKGQVAIPAALRRKLGLEPGDQIEFELDVDRIILKPVVTIPKSQAWFWTGEWQEKEKRAQKDIEEGKTKTYDSVDELAKDLDS